MNGTPVIRTFNLAKSYGELQAVRNLDLSISAHQITAFLGLNGAGKTTTIKMILGMVHPSKGECFVLGRRIDQERDSTQMRMRVAYLSESKQLYDYMTVGQMIRFSRPFYPDWRRDVEKSLLRSYQLPLDRRIRTLSKGMRTKLALLLAFARKPELMILDEPTDGLDPVGVEQMLESLVTQSAEGTTIFFSSHQISEVERVADHVCLLHQGELALDVSLDEIRRSYRRIDMVFPTIPDETAFKRAGVQSIRKDGRQMRILASSNAEELIAMARHMEAGSIEVSPISLRDVFLETVREVH